MEPPPNMEAIRVVNVCGNILSAPGVPGVVLRVAARTMFSQWTVNIRLSRDHQLCMVVEMSSWIPSLPPNKDHDP
jgi:hypothetical protein